MDVKPVAGLQPSVEMNLQSAELKNLSRKNPEVQKQDVKVQQQEQQKLSKELIEKVIQQLKEKLSLLNTQLNISIDKDTDEIVIKVVDKQTNKVIRQIPPEYVLKIAKYIDEITGLLYNEKV